MATDEHLKILKKGVKAWNAWRKENPRVRPELADVYLRNGDTTPDREDIRSPFFDDTTYEAKLSGANLSGADLRGTNLHDANLDDANLEGANLDRADLRRANLSGANLSGTNLDDANLEGAKLDGANLDRTAIGSPLDALGEQAFKSSFAWSRVYVGSADAFNPEHDPDDASYWLIREGDETIHDAVRRVVQEQIGASDEITVEFTRDVWRELLLVELGLREVLGHEAVLITKEDDRLAVTFRNAEDLQRGLEAVMVQVAALDASDPDPVVERVTARPPDGEVVILERAELEQLFGAMEARLREQLDDKIAGLLPDESTGEAPEPKKHALNWADKSLVAFAKLVPWVGTPVSALLEEKLGDAAVQKVTHLDVAQLYGRSLERFQLLKEQQRARR